MDESFQGMPSLPAASLVRAVSTWLVATVVGCAISPAEAQLTISNIGQTNPTNVFLSNTGVATFTTIFEGDGGTTDASDGRGQSFLTPETGDSKNAWNLSSIAVQAQGSGNDAFPTSDFGFKLSIYQWSTNNPEDGMGVVGGGLGGVLLYEDTATMSSSPSADDRYVFNLGTNVLMQENAAYGFVIEFDPDSGVKDSEQFRLRVSGNSGNGIVPGDLWRTEYNVGSSQYSASTNFNNQDLVFYLSGAATTVGDSPILTVDRATGNLSLDANTATALEIIEYDIRTATGGVEPSSWNSIEGQGLDFDDTWFTFTAPHNTTELAEGTLGELPLVGQAANIDFGDAWVPSPFEDVEMFLKLSDGSTVMAQVVYSGNAGQPLALGDYTGPQGLPDGVIDALDWPTVRDNMLRDVSAMDLFGRYFHGDLDRNGAVDRHDFRAFKTAFELQNGTGSFALMVASVPEPSTAMLLLAATAGGLFVRNLRRDVFGTMAVVLLAIFVSRPATAIIVFTETWNTSGGTAGDWTSTTSFSEDRSSDMLGQEGDRSRAINNNGSNGPGYVYNNLTTTQGIIWQSNTRYSIDVLVGHRSPGFSGALDFGLWDGVPGDPTTELSLGTEGYVDVADGDGDPTPAVPAGTFAEATSLTDPSVVQFEFETTAAVPSNDLVLFMRNTRIDPQNGERVYFDNVRLNATSLADFVTLVVDPSNGQMRLRGADTSSQTIDYFQVESAGGHLLTSNWNSLDDQGVGDDAGQPGWEEAGGSNGSVIAEQFLRGGFDAQSNVDIGNSLGAVWDHVNGPADPLADLSFLYTLSDGTDVEGWVTVESISVVDLPGDYNGDGMVNLADYTVWRDALGSTATLPNDATPGTVATEDYDVWKSHFGSIAAAASVAFAVPEPATMILMAFGLLLLTLWARRRQAGHRYATCSAQPSLDRNSRRMQESLWVLAIAATTLNSAVCQANVEINPQLPVGPKVQRWGWDLKGSQGLTNTPAKAQKLYGDVAANLVRIPFFVDAHFSNGSVDTNHYSTMITSIQNILAVNPEVEIFASVKLDGGDTFVGPPSEPDWVTAGTPAWPFDSGGNIFGNQSNRPNPEFYSQLVADYFSYMRNQGIEIDYVGINNETDGALGVNRYIGTVDLLKAELATRRFAVDDINFIAPDSFGPTTAVNIVDNIDSQGRLDTVDIVGSHYYPNQPNHTRDKWVSMSNESGGHDLWHTEVHINPSNANNGAPADLNITRMRRGMGTVFSANKAGGGAVDAQGDLVGVDSLVWWGGGGSDDQIDDTIKREVIDTTIGGHPIFTTPDFDEQTNNDSSPLYQAYVQGNTLTLWVGNPGNEQVDLPVNLLSGRLIDDVHAAPTGTYWQGCDAPGVCNGTYGNTITANSTGELTFDVRSDKLGLTIDSIPFNSIAMLSFDLAASGDLNGDTMLTNADVQQFITGWQAGTAEGDMDFDGDTDRDDWFYLRAAFIDAGQASALTSAVVPEPSSLFPLVGYLVLYRLLKCTNLASHRDI